MSQTRTCFGAAALLVAIATAPANAQGHVAKINGESIYYEVEGSGEPLVLIHGWSLNLRMWDKQAHAFSSRFKVIRYDRRGFGKSSGDEDLSWDVADLDGLLDSLGVKRAHILGMSQGGRVALGFAKSHPDRVSSLILHATSAPDGFPLQWNGPDRTSFEEWGKLAREQGMDAFRRVWAQHPLMHLPPNRAAARATLDEIFAAYRGTRFLNPAQPSGPGPVPTMEDLQRIKAPTLVIHGSDEVPFLQLVAHALAYYIPDARLAVIAGGGHMVNLIEPGRYNGTILTYLKDLQGR
jgi:pimeloyl-ACP methyl ester carboxylesterase